MGDQPNTRSRKVGEISCTQTAPSSTCDCAGLTQVIHEMRKSLEKCFKIIKQQSDKIDTLTTTVEQLQEKQTIISKSQNALVDVSAYSEIVKRGKIKHAQEYTLLIKSNSESKEIITDLTQKIKPEELNVGVRIAKTTQDGKIFLKCDNNESLEKMKNSIENKMGGQVSVNIPMKLNPRIKITNIYKMLHDESNDSLINKILSQNPNISDAQNLKVVYRSKIQKNFFYLILEIDPSTYRSVMKEGILWIAWNRCLVKDHISLSRCFNCCKYGHISKNCRNSANVICPKCGNNHDKNVCQAEFYKCVNCVSLKTKLNLDIRVDHPVWDKDCYSFKKAIEQQRGKIDYFDLVYST